LQILSANQKTVNQSYGGAFPIGKLEPSSSRLQDIEGSLLCIEAPNDNKVNVLSFVIYHNHLIPILSTQPMGEVWKRTYSCQAIFLCPLFILFELIELDGNCSLFLIICWCFYVQIDTENKKTGISPEEVAAFLIGKLEPPSSGQKGVKADLVCIEACNNNKVSTPLCHNQLIAICI
jgi:hypothetical protein